MYLETYSKWEEQYRLNHFPEEKHYLIYILKVKETQEVFYVGCTTLTLKKRLYFHMHNAYNADNYTCPKFAKIRKTRRDKDHIIAEGLFYVDSDSEDALWCENACIHLLNSMYSLTNVHKEIRRDYPYIWPTYNDLLNKVKPYLQKYLANDLLSPRPLE